MILNGVLQKNPSDEDIEKVPIKDRVEICKGRIVGFVFENWWLNIEQESQIDFSYNALAEGDVKKKRDDFFERLGHKPEALRKLILPPDYFSEEGVKIPDYGL